MFDSPPDPLQNKPLQAESERRLTRLPWRTYRLRVLGMGLAALPVMAVLQELGSPWPAWVWVVASCFLWPHLAFLWATRSGQPFRGEMRNFMLDSAWAASWLPLMHFNLLPSVVLLTVVSADKLNTGIRGLWQRSLPGMALALVAFGLMTGFAVQYSTSTWVMLACLPIMVIHTLSVSASSYRLVRRVQTQNLQLDELSRLDALTGLGSRRDFQQQADALLQEHAARGVPATLLLVDLDYLKDINDRHGHNAGDDVLRAIGGLIRDRLGEREYTGRLGGDEIGIVLRRDRPQAEAFAESLRSAVEVLRFEGYPGLTCSISVGLAEPTAVNVDLRGWMEAADRALYSAKHAGRNRAASSAAGATDCRAPEAQEG